MSRSIARQSRPPSPWFRSSTPWFSPLWLPALLACNIGHDLAHLHGLAWRHLLNAENDLIIWSACDVLNQRPKTFQHLPLIFRRPASSDQKRQRGGGCRLTSRKAASRRI